jgi:hypothetical protein
MPKSMQFSVLIKIIVIDSFNSINLDNHENK